MKYILILLILFNNIVANSFLVGGNIPIINTVTNIGNIFLDLSRDGNKEEIVLFTIDNNTSSFELTLQFKNNGNFINEETNQSISPYELIITEAGTGILGHGIEPLINKEMLPMFNNEFVWQPENQESATVNYSLKILASWYNQNVLAGLYQETIITTIKAIM